MSQALAISALALLLAGCSPNDPAIVVVDAGDTAPVDAAEIDATSGVGCRAPSGAHIMFVNIAGGTYTPGSSTSPINNVSSLLSSSVTFGPWTGDNDALLDCLRETLTRYDVLITTTEPQADPYFEIAVTDTTSNELDLGNTGGFAEFSCDPLDSNIGFLFNDPGALVACRSVGRFVGGSYGLSLELNECESVLTGSPICEERLDFLDSEQQCILSSQPPTAGPCCDGDTQNAHQQLLEELGPCPE
jgi:hypothetical protein